MSVKTFPSSIPNPSYPLKAQPENTSITSKFEDGSMVSRRKFTRARLKFTLQWNSLKNAEYMVLNNFIVNSVGFAAEAFVWHNPMDNKDYTVRCTSYDGGTLNSVDFWNVQMELTEV